MDDKLLLIGGGGHCHSVMDSVLSGGIYNEIGVVAKDPDNYSELLSDTLVAPYLVGMDADLPRLFEEGWKNAFITLGSVGSTKGRRALYATVLEIGFEFTTVIDSSAIVSKYAEIAQGSFIGKQSVINTGCRIGVGTIINTGAIIEHDCNIGDFVHISPGTTICGQVTIGNDSHIGARSVVRQQISIGSNSLVGAGSVIVKDIPNDVTAYGNPCRVIE